jgi:hypothetical protein
MRRATALLPALAVLEVLLIDLLRRSSASSRQSPEGSPTTATSSMGDQSDSKRHMC